MCIRDSLLIAVYVTINLHDLAPKGSGLRADLKVWHFMLGLCVFVLLIARLGTRLSSGVTPRITPPLSRWMKRSSDAMHILLYIFMFGMPVLGWLAVSAKGDPIIFLGLQLPALIGQDKVLYSSLKKIHETDVYKRQTGSRFGNSPRKDNGLPRAPLLK